MTRRSYHDWQEDIDPSGDGGASSRAMGDMCFCGTSQRTGIGHPAHANERTTSHADHRVGYSISRGAMYCRDCRTTV